MFFFLLLVYFGAPIKFEDSAILTSTIDFVLADAAIYPNILTVCIVKGAQYDTLQKVPLFIINCSSKTSEIPLRWCHI